MRNNQINKTKFIDYSYSNLISLRLVRFVLDSYGSICLGPET